MMKTDALIENPLPQQPLDLVVGIPSYNEADNIAFVVEQSARGIRKYFPECSAAIVNADNFSQDGTKEAFLEAGSEGIHKVYLSTPEGVVGKGNNFHNLFQYLEPYDPKAAIVVDADLLSISPEWIQGLGKPVLGSFDFVSPLYNRNEYDGTITNHLCYPLLYGILGKNIRQPIGGDFAFSGRVMKHWLKQTWTPSIRQYGVDIFMTLEAISRDFSLGQVSLGAKIHKPSAPKLGPMFTQVVDTLFRKVLEARDAWCLNGERPVKPRLIHPEGIEKQGPQDLGFDYKALKRKSLQEFEKNGDLTEQILDPELFSEIKEMIDRKSFRISRSNWAEIVYSFLLRYRTATSAEGRLDIVEALKPLYFARVVSFIRETLELDHKDSERRIVSQAKVFWRQRFRLLSE